MNDNPTRWEYRAFDIHTAGGMRAVEGMTRGIWGVFDWDFNGIEWHHDDRISVTHLPTGRRVGFARHGAQGMRIVEALLEEPRFGLVTQDGNAVVGLRKIAVDVFARHGGTFSASMAA